MRGGWRGASAGPYDGGTAFSSSGSLCSPQVLTDWVNTQLLAEHIVVRSLEEDMFDGLVLHHLFRECGVG